VDRIDIKTTETQLRQEFIQEYGYPQRIAEALVNNHPKELRDGQVICRK